MLSGRVTDETGAVGEPSGLAIDSKFLIGVSPTSPRGLPDRRRTGVACILSAIRAVSAPSHDLSGTLDDSRITSDVQSAIRALTPSLTPPLTTTLDRFSYDDDIVRKFLFATLLWGAVGMLVGLLIALQLANPFFNFNTAWLSFGRLRPLHTNAVIFAFAGNAFFTGCYYSTQRLLKARMFSDALSRFHFWGWQAISTAASRSRRDCSTPRRPSSSVAPDVRQRSLGAGHGARRACW